MKISKELLLENGFNERVVDGQTVYVKGHVALVYIFNVWIPCHYSYGALLTNQLYISSMEELEELTQLN